MNVSTTTYDESKIKTLSSLDHIRKRPGMYIGRLGDGSNHDDGIYILLKEVVDNSIDEFIMGAGKRINIAIDPTGYVTVRDFGRGIPLGKVVDCVSTINTGAKYNTDVFQFSVGLNGVGTKAVNALSELFIVTSYRDGKFVAAKFNDGKLIDQQEGETEEKNGTCIEFLPSAAMFPDFAFDPLFVEKRLWRYAYLNAGLKIYFDKKVFYSANGLLDLLGKELDGAEVYTPAMQRLSLLFPIPTPSATATSPLSTAPTPAKEAPTFPPSAKGS